MMIALRFLSFFLMAAAVVFGQPVNPPVANRLELAKSVCADDVASGPKFLAYLPVTLTIGPSTGSFTTPVCIALGTSLRLDQSGPVAKLEAVIPALPAIPAPLKNVVEKFSLPPNLPASQETITFTLQKTPSANSAILAFFYSPFLGFDSTDAIQHVSGKDIIMELPKYRPFTTEKLTIVYWTTE